MKEKISIKSINYNDILATIWITPKFNRFSFSLHASTTFDKFPFLSVHSSQNVGSIEKHIKKMDELACIVELKLVNQ